MNRNSLQLRLLIAAAISIGLAVTIAGFLLIRIFERNLTARIDEELATYVNQIAGRAQFSADGDMFDPQGLADPRFERPYGGLYWQVDDHERDIQLRSKSLWDYEIPLPVDDHPSGEVHRYRLAGPASSTLIVQERQLIFSTPAGKRPIRIAVGLDEAGLVGMRQQFTSDIIPYMAVLAVFLLLAAGIQVRVGLKPLQAIRKELDAISQRRRTQLDGAFPSEIQQLVTALNALLATQARTMERARRRASDLAHGLKTPLTALRGNASRLRAGGEAELADEIEELVGVMKAQIDHELIRTRIAPDPEQRKSDADLAVVLAQVVRTLRKTPLGERLNWVIDINEAIIVPLDPDDLRELLGNLVENAAKWARQHVTIMAQEQVGKIHLLIADDGPGVAEDKIPNLFERGVRLDERMPGTGLGLSIVKEIAEVYALGIVVRNKLPSGLLVEIIFPSTAKGSAN